MLLEQIMYRFCLGGYAELQTAFLRASVPEADAPFDIAIYMVAIGSCG